MKKLIVCLTLLLIFSSSFKTTEIKTTERVLAIFNETFKNVENLEWHITDNTYSAHFINKNVITSITYDKDVKFVCSRRSIPEETLPVNILTQIKEKYRGKTIRLISEIVERNELLYCLTIDDEINCWIVQASPSGECKLLSKFKKQQ